MRIFENEPMAPHTTFRIGGRAEHLFEPCNEQDIEELLDRLNGEMDRAFFMGRGSNLLIKDGLVRTPFVRLSGQFKNIEFGEESVTAGAAVPMPELSMKAAREGFYGLEWASGVPGTVGGAVMMNAGAFDHNTQERLTEIRVMDRDGSMKTIEREEIDFDYRHCDIRGDYLVLSATFRLEPAEAEAVRENTQELIQERREQQPVGYHSAGCIFKNGDDYYAAELIDEAGLKGASEGNVYVSEQHANYMINRGGARSDDVLRLIDRVRRRISSEYGKDLELELCIVDE